MLNQDERENYRRLRSYRKPHFLPCRYQTVNSSPGTEGTEVLPERRRTFHRPRSYGGRNLHTDAFYRRGDLDWCQQGWSISHNQSRFTRKTTVPDVRAQSYEQEKWDCAYVSTMNVCPDGAYAAKEFPGLLAKSSNPARNLRNDYDAALAEYDLPLTPTLPSLAPSPVAPTQCCKSRPGSR